MTYFNRGNDRGSNQNFGRRDFNDRGGDRPQLFDAICAQCGASCKVPFKPNGRKEVFCSKCFEMNGGGAKRESGFGDSRSPKMFDRRDSQTNYNDREMFSATCDQCGERCQVPFRPTQGKPVLCSNCFAGKTDSRPSRNNSNLDLEAINAKLDKILKLLTPKPTPDAAITEKILETIEATSGKKPGKPKAKKAKAE